MEKAFLRQVASLFVNDSLEGYTFVFPNRRSSLFFLKHLGDLSPSPVFSPRIFTIDKLFGYLSDLEVADDLSLIFRLWKVYRDYQIDYQKETGTKEEDLKVEEIDDFFSWGKIILSDFNDVDQYMVDADRLFSNIKDLNELKSDASVLSPRQYEALERLVNMKTGLKPDEHIKRKYLQIWDMLLPLYQAFRLSLKEDGLAYRGMQYREVAEKIENLDIRLKGLGTVVFIGFSAPTECEKLLMRRCRMNGAIFYWDYYSDLLRAKQNRSSHLISGCVEEFPTSRPLALPDGGWEKGRCRFKVIPAGGSTEQAMIASHLLKKIKSEGIDGLDTAIVVSDETLLIPLLDFMGEDNLNVTMGYPLKATAAASFFFTVFDLHLRSRLSSDRILLPGEVVMSLLGHPYIKEMDPEGAAAASAHIQKNNYYMLDSSELEKDNPLDIDSGSNLAAFLKNIIPEKGMFPSPDNSDISTAILSYCRNVAEFVSRYVAPSERLFIRKFLEIFDRVSSSGIRFGKERSVYSVIRSAVKSASIPFRGEPLEGIQIMGALETRALDFDRIIFLSFNEGTYPASGERSSSIPYFLRKGFGLPTYENENSISAYNFYRLIQRASEVYMVYDTANTDSLKSKEESRFVKQLVYDFGVEPQQIRFEYPVPSSSKPFDSELVMSDADRAALGNFFTDLNTDEQQKGFSASSLNYYIDCQRKFFFSKILGLKEEKDLSDTVEADKFGSILHYCMEHIYDDFMQDKQPLLLDPARAEEIRKKVFSNDYLDNLILEAFGSEMHVRRIEGQNLIIKGSVKEYIRQILDADISKAQDPYCLIDNEYPVSLDLGKEFSNAYFKGYLDRVETIGGIPRICDYKTGSFLDLGSSGIIETLKTGNYQFRPDPHYLPIKDLEEDKFESCLDKMFSSTEKRSHFHTILLLSSYYLQLHPIQHRLHQQIQQICFLETRN